MKRLAHEETSLSRNVQSAATLSGGNVLPNPARLLAPVRDAIRLRHDGIRTEPAYLDGVKRFIRFHGKRHPRDRGALDVERLLTHLAVERNAAASTQHRALSALLVLY